MDNIADILNKKTIFITGATGFLGTALVERLLRCAGDCQIVLLIRSSSRTSALKRLEKDLLNNDCFDPLKKQLGERFRDVVSSRVTVVEGDVTRPSLGLDQQGMEQLARCDIVIHSAATVAFDSPLDSAIEINLLGPSRVAQAIRDASELRSRYIAERQDSQAGQGTQPTQATQPTQDSQTTQDSQNTYPATHLVSISTAYVAGTHQGNAEEMLATQAIARNRSSRTTATVTTDVYIDAEIDFARRLRSDLQAESRRPERLKGFVSAARKEMGSAGPHLLAERSERLRQDWVKESMVEAGKSRSQSMGWPDAYAFTKALGERMLTEQYRDIPISIVRPSIIESAISQPYPGWIRGFRMAEPIIISYAKGLLKEFPGTPEGIIDVIPVDMVVSAIMAVAAHGPSFPETTEPSTSFPLQSAETAQESDTAATKQDGNAIAKKSTRETAQHADPPVAVYHVATGSRNPLRYGTLVDLVKEWFSANPLYDADGQPIDVPEWSFPGRGRVQAQLKRSIKMLALLERINGTVPIHSFGQDLSAKLEESRTKAERALAYAELYGAYTETDAVFMVNRLLALYSLLHDDDKQEYCFDPATIDWDAYVRQIHLPSVISHARVRTSPTSTRSASRSERALRAILSPDREMAVFDLENTLISANVVDSYLWLANRHLDGSDRLSVISKLAVQLPRLVMMDRKDRGDFLRTFYRLYENADIDELQKDALEFFHSYIMNRSYPAGFARLKKHRNLGHRTVLITGSLDFLVAPLQPLFDEIICAKLDAKDSKATGRLASSPPTGEARALLLARYAETNGIDLSQSVAYGDSVSDLPLLESVGFPVAVNADQKLSAMAKKRGWHSETWKTAAPQAKQLVAIPPQAGGRRLTDLLLSKAFDMMSQNQRSGYRRTVGESGMKSGGMRRHRVSPDKSDEIAPKLASAEVRGTRSERDEKSRNEKDSK